MLAYHSLQETPRSWDFCKSILLSLPAGASAASARLCTPSRTIFPNSAKLIRSPKASTGSTSKSLLFKLRKFPVRATVEFTNHYNFSCGYCPSSLMDRPEGCMGVDFFASLVQQLEKAAARS